MSKKKKPKKWTDVYPAGTKEGDEECKLFISLARNPKYEWRSTAALVKESCLSKKRVEEILSKYHKKGMIFQSPKNEDHWGYWERVPEMLPDENESLAKKDRNVRIDKAMKDDIIIENGNSKRALLAEIASFGKKNKASLAERLFPQLFTVALLKKELNLKTADEI